MGHWDPLVPPPPLMKTVANFNKQRGDGPWLDTDFSCDGVQVSLQICVSVPTVYGRSLSSCCGPGVPGYEI